MEFLWIVGIASVIFAIMHAISAFIEIKSEKQGKCRNIKGSTVGCATACISLLIALTAAVGIIVGMR